MSLLARCIRPKVSASKKEVKFSENVEIDSIKYLKWEDGDEIDEIENESEEEPYYDTPYDGPYKKC